MRERADRATDLANGHCFARFHLAITSHLVVPKRERQTERSRFSVNAVRSSDLWCVLEFMRTTLQHREQHIDLLQQNVAGITQQQRVRGINYIGRSQTVMNEARGFTDRFRQIRGEGDHVMVGCLLDLMDARDRKLCAHFDLLQRLARDRSHLSVYFANGNFHVEPFLELGLFSPERAHFGKCVSFNHRLLDPQITQITPI